MNSCDRSCGKPAKLNILTTGPFPEKSEDPNSGAIYLIFNYEHFLFPLFLIYLLWSFKFHFVAAVYHFSLGSHFTDVLVLFKIMPFPAAPVLVQFFFPSGLPDSLLILPLTL